MKLERETKIGIFTIAAVSILYIGYNFLKGKRFFADVKEYYVVFNSIEGVVKSTPVYYKGLKVGQVDKITLIHADTANRILALLAVDGKISLSKTSSAIIVSQDLLGSKAIKLEIPDLNQKLQNRDTLRGIDEEDLLTPIKDKSERVLMSIEKLLTEVNYIMENGGRKQISSGISDLSDILNNLKQTSESLNLFIAQERKSISTSIDNFETVSNALKGSTGNLTKTANNLKQITDSLANAPIKQSFEHIEKASSELNILLTQINAGEGTMGKLAKDSILYHNLNRSAFELQSLLKDFQEYPARYVNVSVFGNASKKADKQRAKDKKKQSSK